MRLLSNARILRPTDTAIYVAGAVAATLMVSAVTPALAQSLVPIGAMAQTSTTVPIINSFDISYVDPATSSYVLGDRTQQAVDLFNTQTLQETFLVGKGAFTGATGNNNTSGPDGVMIVNSNEIWAGDGNSTLKVFSMGGTYPMIANINTGGVNRVDEMCYDPVHQIAMAANNADNPPFATFFNIATHTIIKKVAFDGTGGTPLATNGAEQCRWNPRDQKFYISIPEVNGPGDNSANGGLTKIDPVTQTVIANYLIPVTACRGPQGLAIGPAPQMLLGCVGGPGQPANGFPTAVINDGTTGGVAGSVLATLLNEAGSDMVNYDSFSNTYQLAESSFNPPPPTGNASCSPPITAGPQHLGVVAASTDTEGTSVVTGLYNCPTRAAGGNHSVASDPTNGHVFFPVSSTSGATLCSQFGFPDSSGCIMVFQATGNNGSALGADIIWRDTSGDVAFWAMNGASVASSVAVGTLSNTWSIVGKGDFLGNGNLDLLWRDTSGNLAMWLMTNGVLTSNVPLGNVPTTWSVAGTGDYNGDGRADILWRDTSGNVVVWIMNGANVTSAAYIANIPTNWSIVGSRHNQVVWRDTLGDVAMWTMNGATVLSTVAIGTVPLTYTIAALGDFNGDGTLDIMWRDGAGNVSVWLLNSSGGVSSALPVGSVAANWLIAQSTDFNFDYRSDLLFRDTTGGGVAMWFMNGASVLSSAFVGNVPLVWSVQGTATNP